MFYSELVFLHSYPLKKTYNNVEKANRMLTRKENSKLIPKVFFPVLRSETGSRLGKQKSELSFPCELGIRAVFNWVSK